MSTSVAEELLAQAEVLLYQAKVDALLGRRYDPDEYDQIVMRYRRAKWRADEARWAAHQAATPATAKRFQGMVVPAGAGARRHASPLDALAA